MQAISFYEDDLPSSFLVRQEIDIWKHRWMQVAKENRPVTLAKWLSVVDEVTFLNLFILLKIATTLPVTSCEYEISFSAIRPL